MSRLLVRVRQVALFFFFYFRILFVAQEVFIVKEINIMTIDKDKLQEIVNSCKTKKEVIEKLGLNYNGGTRRSLRYTCQEFGIDLSGLDNKLTKEKYDLNPKYCLYCGEKIPYNKRINSFCSSSCSTTYNNSKRVREKKTISTEEKIKTPEIRYCENCGEVLHEHQERFCSHKCHLEYDHKKYIERWQRGEEDGMKGEYGLSSHIKRYLLQKHDYKCEKCNWGEINKYTHTIPLEIHHIDGDYRNNREENLQVLCPNCHSLTETHKSHNKEGRKGRDKYYQ